MQDTFVLFEIAGATYGVRSSQVRSIEMIKAITRVPNALGFVEGVAAIRGRLLPVVSVRKRFHMDPLPLDIRARFVVVQLDERLVGMQVDTAREFIHIDTDQVTSVEGLSSPGVEYLDGVVTLQNRLILIVNLERLLNSREREDLQQVMNDANAVAKKPTLTEHSGSEFARRTN